MFGIDSSEFLLVALVALVVIGPKDLPKAMRVVGYWVGKARGVARQFRSGFDDMVREVELADMEKKWAAENERIMREHPTEVPLHDHVAPEHVTSEHGPETEPVADAPHGGVARHDDPAMADMPGPVMVEKPLVEPAPDGTAPLRGDGVTS